MGAAKHAFFSGLRMELAGFCPSSQIAFKEAWIQVLILPYLVCLVCGCAKERDISNEFLADNRTKPVSSTRIASQETGEHEQDLGFIMAGGTRVCDFILSNNTDRTWHIRSVQAGCSCMVPRISTTEVLPGGRSIVTIAYRAPNANLDDVKNVRVRFSDSDGIPDAIFVLRAKVRKKMAVFPEAFQLGLLSTDSMKEFSFDVVNHTGIEWSNIDIEGFDNLTFTCKAMVSRKESQHILIPIQAWRVSAVVEAGAASADVIRRSVRIRASGASETIEELVAVQWRSGTGILPVPSELSLGKVARETSVVSSLTLIAAAAFELSISDLVVVCEPAELLSATVKQAQGRVMTVNVLLKVPADYPQETMNGYLRVHNRTATRELAVIPITVRSE